MVDDLPGAAAAGRVPPGAVAERGHPDPGLRAAVGVAAVAGAVALVADPGVAGGDVDLDPEAVAVALLLGDGDGRGQHGLAGRRLQQGRVAGDHRPEEAAQVGHGGQGGPRPGRGRHPGGRDQGPAGQLEMPGGRPGLGLGGGHGLRGGHGARVEHVALERLGIGAAGDPLQHQPEHGVADVRVVGPLAGRPARRGVGEGQRLRGRRRRAFHAADDPGGVAQQVPDRDRPERGGQGQPGQVAVDRGVQLEPARLVLAEQGQGRHHLADRGHREQRPRLQRPAGGDVVDAGGELVPPPTRPDQPDGQAGQGQPLPHEPLQPLRRGLQRPGPGHPRSSSGSRRRHRGLAGGMIPAC